MFLPSFSHCFRCPFHLYVHVCIIQKCASFPYQHSTVTITLCLWTCNDSPTDIIKIILMFKQYVPMKYVVFSFSYNIPCVCSYCYMHILHLELWNVFFLNSVTGECASYPCANGGSCVGGIDSYECKCMPGFTGTQCITGIVIHSNRLLRGQHYKYTMNV